MKKVIVPVVIVIVLIVGFVVSIPLVNDRSAKNVEKQLVEVALPDNTEMIESLSKAGKLVGNGNGIIHICHPPGIVEISVFQIPALKEVALRGKPECVIYYATDKIIGIACINGL